MFRKFLIALVALGATLGASACTYSSAVDIAPIKERIAKPAIAPGDYCGVKGKAPPFAVTSSEDCAPITWDIATRTYTMKDPEKPGEDVTVAVVRLDNNLYAVQAETPESKEGRYQILVMIASGNAFAMLSSLDDATLKTLADKTKKLTFKPAPSGRVYIAAGKPEDIKAFLKEAAKESLRKLKTEKDDLTVGVRDIAGAPDHSAGKAQEKDIADVFKAAAALTPK